MKKIKKEFSKIKNEKQLKKFLITEKNDYCNFILAKITKKEEKLNSIAMHNHHIIPRHSNGPDVQWNRIRLSINDHIHAHRLLYFCYGNLYDLAAANMLQGNQKKGTRLIQKQNQMNMKKQKIGFYNSMTQREFAKRPRKKRKPFAKNIFVKAALKKGFILKHIETNQTMVIKPNETKNVTEVIDLLISHPQMEEKRASWNDCQKKEKSFPVSALTRILTGHRDKKTQKSVYSFMGWRLLGIFIF